MLIDVEALRRRINALGLDAQKLVTRGGARDQRLTDLEAVILELEAGIEALVELREEIERKMDAGEPADEFTAPDLSRSTDLGGTTFRQRGWSDLVSGDPVGATRWLRRALALDPEDRPAQALLAWAFFDLDQIGDAETVLLHLFDTEPDHPLGLVVKGKLRLRKGKVADAIEAFRLAGSGQDRTATLYAGLGMGVAYSASGNHEIAQQWLRAAIQVAPELGEAYWELGRSYFESGRGKHAIAAWRAGAANQFSPWGKKCRAEIQRLETDLNASGSG